MLFYTQYPFHCLSYVSRLTHYTARTKATRAWNDQSSISLADDIELLLCILIITTRHWRGEAEDLRSDVTRRQRTDLNSELIRTETDAAYTDLVGATLRRIYVCVCVCVCACACACACVRACVRECVGAWRVRERVCACVSAYVCVRVIQIIWGQNTILHRNFSWGLWI